MRLVKADTQDVIVEGRPSCPGQECAEVDGEGESRAPDEVLWMNNVEVGDDDEREQGKGRQKGKDSKGGSCSHATSASVHVSACESALLLPDNAEADGTHLEVGALGPVGAGHGGNEEDDAEGHGGEDGDEPDVFAEVKAPAQSGDVVLQLHSVRGTKNDESYMRRIEHEEEECIHACVCEWVHIAF